jgi:hypothetical protein
VRTAPPADRLTRAAPTPLHHEKRAPSGAPNPGRAVSNKCQKDFPNSGSSDARAPCYTETDSRLPGIFPVKNPSPPQSLANSGALPIAVRRVRGPSGSLLGHRAEGESGLSESVD